MTDTTRYVLGTWGRKVWAFTKNAGAICGIIAIVMSVSIIYQRTEDNRAKQVASCQFGNQRAEEIRQAVPEVQDQVVEAITDYLDTPAADQAQLQRIATEAARRVMDEKVKDRDCSALDSPTTTTP